jgi:hypothetical protein
MKSRRVRARAARNLFGPGLTTVTGYLKGREHLSYITLRAVVKDILGITVSGEFLANQAARVSESLKEPCEELAGQLPEAAGQVLSIKDIWTYESQDLGGFIGKNVSTQSVPGLPHHFADFHYPPVDS